VLGQDVQAHMLLRDALDRRCQGSKIVDVLGIGEHGARQRLGLGAGLAVVRLVEEVADLLVLEHALVHTLRDRQTVLLERGNGGLHEMDGGVAQCVRHGMTSWMQHRGKRCRRIGPACAARRWAPCVTPSRPVPKLRLPP
jgi:hypothetical protein